jgi:hypothetical protein
LPKQTDKKRSTKAVDGARQRGMQVGQRIGRCSLVRPTNRPTATRAIGSRARRRITNRGLQPGAPSAARAELIPGAYESDCQGGVDCHEYGRCGTRQHGDENGRRVDVIVSLGLKQTPVSRETLVLNAVGWNIEKAKQKIQNAVIATPSIRSRATSRQGRSSRPILQLARC